MWLEKRSIYGTLYVGTLPHQKYVPTMTDDAPSREKLLPIQSRGGRREKLKWSMPVSYFEGLSFCWMERWRGFCGLCVVEDLDDTILD